VLNWNPDGNRSLIYKFSDCAFVMRFVPMVMKKLGLRISIAAPFTLLR
jgi:hypothetical protein